MTWITQKRWVVVVGFAVSACALVLSAALQALFDNWAVTALPASMLPFAGSFVQQTRAWAQASVEDVVALAEELGADEGFTLAVDLANTHPDGGIAMAQLLGVPLETDGDPVEHDGYRPRHSEPSPAEQLLGVPPLPAPGRTAEVQDDPGIGYPPAAADTEPLD